MLDDHIICFYLFICLFFVDYRHDGGTFRIAIFDVAVTFVVRLGREVNGHPFVASVSCEADVGGLDMQFYGGARYDRKSRLIAVTKPDTGGSP